MLDLFHNFWLLAAGLAAGATTLIHIFAGGPTVAAPLLAAQDIDETPKLTNYYSWHLVSLMLIAMSGGFLYAAATPGEGAFAATWTLIAAASTGWSLTLIVWKVRPALDLPQWTLITLISALGAAGLF